MKHRSTLACALGVVVFACVAIASATGAPFSPTLTISGAPGNGLTTFSPLSLTTTQLAALPQQTITVAINGVSTTESGPSLSALLTKAGLQYISTCKNDELRYWIEATSARGASTEVTAGEIDPSFGDKPAILSIDQNGSSLSAPRLIVPGDATDARDIPDVVNITVGRAAPQLAETTAACNPPGFTAPVSAPSSPPAGSVLINGDVPNPTTVTFAQLQALPQVTQTDSYKSGGSAAKPHTETGPTLYSVLAAAEPGLESSDPANNLDLYVEVTSSEDGFAVLVSWAEIDPALNGNQVLLSLIDQGVSVLTTDTGPRLTVPGDVQGGRYDFGVQVVTVFRAPLEFPSPTPPVPPVPPVKVTPVPPVPPVTTPGATVSAATSSSSASTAHAAAVPASTADGATVPAVTVPGVTVPGETVLGVTFPGVTVPGVTVPGVTVPGVTVPSVTAPTMP
jgi:hypothetical protein